MNKYMFTKYGTFMNNALNKGAKFLMRHKFLYYLLNHTWGIINTLIGYLISFILIEFKKEPKSNGFTYYFEVGKYWGGFSMGIMFVRDETSYEKVNYHETGHSFQNALLGPFFIFLVAIPSFIRYRYQEMRTRKGKSNKDYDSIWFEYNASLNGECYKEYVSNKK